MIWLVAGYLVWITHPSYWATLVGIYNNFTSYTGGNLMHQDSFLFVLSAMINDFLIRLLWIRKLWDLTRQNNTRILRIYFCALLVHAPLKNTYPFDKKTACLTVGSVGTACLITNSPDSTVYTSTYIYKETIGIYLHTYIIYL